MTNDAQSLHQAKIMLETQAARIERLEADTLRLYRIGMEGLQDFAAQRKEVKRLRAALHRISLASQINSTTTEDLGREARAALEEEP